MNNAKYRKLSGIQAKERACCLQEKPKEGIDMKLQKESTNGPKKSNRNY